MKHWKEKVLAGLMIVFIVGVSNVYAAERPVDYDYIGMAYTIQTFPYQYKDSGKLLDVYEKLLDDGEICMVKEESKPFSSSKYYIQTVNAFEADCYYYGKIKNGRPDGKGVLLEKYEDDLYVPYYIGEFSEGYFSGSGIEYRYGIEEYLDDNMMFYEVVYEGEYKKGKRNGKGCKYYTASNALYNIMNRSAEISFDVDDITEFDMNSTNVMDLIQDTIVPYENASIQKGDYLSSYPLVYISRSREGEWKNGELDGKGTVYDAGNYQYATGKFKKGVLNGDVTIYYPFMSQIAYEGEMKSGDFSGNGTLYYGTGNIKYKGNFKKGKYSGKGTLYNEDGSVKYKGKFKDGDVA